MPATAQSQTMTMEACVERCTECYETCTQTVGYCLEQGGDHARHMHIRMLMDCAEICRTSADFMVRGSPYYALICFVCSEISDACAEDCERLGDDHTMRECAEVCRRCAEACRTMAIEAGISVERAGVEGYEGVVDYGEAFEQVASAADEEARTSGGRTRSRSNK